MPQYLLDAAFAEALPPDLEPSIRVLDAAVPAM
jgi:hypothetical protein